MSPIGNVFGHEFGGVGARIEWRQRGREAAISIVPIEESAFSAKNSQSRQSTIGPIAVVDVGSIV